MDLLYKGLLVLLIIFACEGYSSLASGSTGKAPNIVLMIADDLGIGDIGCFGNTTLRTPNIDRIAAEGVRLTHDLATASICTPSRAAFQTGRYQTRMGMASHNFVRAHFFATNTGGLPKEEVTIADLAKTRGYKTAFIGKWHLGIRTGQHPNDQGYDYFYGIPVSNARILGHVFRSMMNEAFPNLIPIIFGIALGGIVFAYALKRFNIIGSILFCLLVFIALTPSLFIGYIAITSRRSIGIVLKDKVVVEQPIILDGFTDRMIREGVNFLQDRRDDDKPFLLVMSWLQVHTALHAIRPFRGASAHGPYGDEVEEMDWSVGEIIKALDSLGLARNTFVYFSSDHGGHLEEKGFYGNQEGGHNGIYKGGKAQGGMEGGIRVPTVARLPGVIPKGSQVHFPTSQMDVLPTLADIMGAEVPRDRIMDGVNILPLLRGEPSERPHDFLVHYCGHLVHAARYMPEGSGEVFKVFYATHKYFPGTYQCRFACSCTNVNWHDPPVLYNVARDPSEEHPLDVTTSENKAILDKISQLLENHKSSIKPVPSQFSFFKVLPRPWLEHCCNFPNCQCQEKDPRI